jgi:hypothetical protein
MNDRIRELLDSAGLGIRHDGIVLTQNVSAADALEHFAQSLVEECMRMCETAQIGFVTHGLYKEAEGAGVARLYIHEYLGAE